MSNPNSEKRFDEVFEEFSRNEITQIVQEAKAKASSH